AYAGAAMPHTRASAHISDIIFFILSLPFLLSVFAFCTLPFIIAEICIISTSAVFEENLPKAQGYREVFKLNLLCDYLALEA
ncbi:MAG: hypothetical protein IJC18_01920, partial [Clostridia bacterium]|nr:hypothetical protein [Clostridia bacterium]